MSAITEPTAPVCGQSSPNADNLRTCSACQNDLVCHDLGECRRPTPETDAEELHDPYLVRELPFCVVRIDFVRRLERERDEARAELAAMREAVAVTQALAEWSARYPRGISHSRTHQMDAELIELEERAKAATTKLQPFTAAAEPANLEGGTA